jgi:RecA/RadA recombinase
VRTDSGEFLSTGSTLLNLAISGHIDKGYRCGTCNLVVGDSNSGKTFTSLTCLAEATKDPKFDRYQFYYDNPEHGALMDLAKFFGKKCVARIQPPRRDEKGNPIFSRTLQEFYYNFDDTVKKGEPVIYVVDSIDALDSDEDTELFEENKELTRKGKETKGSFGMQRAKINSTHLRVVASKLQRTNSIMILVSQTRESPKMTPWGATTEKVRAGGKALKFYSRVEFWTSVKKDINARALGKDYQIGSLIEADFKKNHISGWENKVIFPIYRAVGIDDLGGCIGYLVNCGYWTADKETITTKGLKKNVKGKLETIAAHIQKHSWEQEIRQLVGKVWAQIEEKTRVIRKQRYE